MAKTFEKANGGSGDGAHGSGTNGNANASGNASSGYCGDKDRNELGNSNLANGAPKLVAEEPEPDFLPEPEDVYGDREIREEAQEARHLYLDFVRHELQRRGIDEPACLNSVEEDDIDSAKAMIWTRTGRELRQLADVFSRSKERESVRRRAEAVSVNSLDFDHFILLLQELFQGGSVTRERILILFFFCADLAIETLRLGYHDSFHMLMKWALKYIVTRVARWVHDHGGWVAVLRSTLSVAYQLSACCALIAVTVACVVYIRRNPHPH